MIYETLQILKEQIDDYFSEIGLVDSIILDNIALWESGNYDAEKLNDKVVVTLLKFEEEATLKNSPYYKLNNLKTEYKNPPVHLNLYLLICASFQAYDRSLRSISKVIEFFQSKKVFTSTNTAYNRNNVSMDVLDHFKFNVDIYTPTFEELNNIWGTLGGRQMPSVIYKVQLIQIESDKKLAASEAITQISGTINDMRQ